MAARSGNEPAAGRGSAAGPPGGTAASGAAGPVANDRFKSSAPSWFWASLAAAVLIHFAIFTLWPEFDVVDVSVPPAEMAAVLFPPTVDLPPIPEAPERPALPAVPADLGPDPNLDLASLVPVVDFEQSELPPIPPAPVVEQEQTVPGFDEFTPYTVAPELRNRQEVTRALRARYPSHLQRAGIGGEVLFWFWIDEAGTVHHHEMKRSSGRRELDDAALEVVEIMRFSPALNRGRAVRVVVALPIVFEVR